VVSALGFAAFTLAGCGGGRASGPPSFTSAIRSACTTLLEREQAVPRPSVASLFGHLPDLIGSASAQFAAINPPTQSTRASLLSLVSELRREARIAQEIQRTAQRIKIHVIPDAMAPLLSAFQTTYLRQIQELKALDAGQPCVPDTSPTPPAPGAGKIGAKCRRMMVLAFEPRSDEWSRAAAARAGIGFIVADIGSGPGWFPYGEATYPIREAQRHGIRVLGYVYSDTDSAGLRPLVEAEHDIRIWARYYPVNGYFVDSVQAEPRYLEYYKRLFTYIRRRSPDAFIVFNISATKDFDPAFVNLANVLNLYEADPTTFSERPPYAVTRAYPARRFGAVVFATPRTQLDQVLALAAARNLGNVYVTDRPAPDRYRQLPEYFTQELQALTRSCPRAGVSS
jgi:hypothetical protein